MSENSFIVPILIGIVFFVLSILLFVFIKSPHPYFAGVVVAFFAFEIAFYYRFNKRYKNEHTNKLL